jgi:hypothetical protein
MASEKDRDADVGASESVSGSRRSFLFVAGAASCVAFTGGAARTLSRWSEGERVARASRGALVERPTTGEAHALAAKLPVGTPLHTSTVAAVHPIRLGAIAVVMRRLDGSTFQLDLLRGAGQDGSVAQSSRTSVFAVNGGTGRSATAEPDGLAARALARVLAAAEESGMPALNLLTHAERARLHPAGVHEVRV